MSALKSETILTLTDKAAEKVLTLLDGKTDGAGLRLGTEAYGCSGLGYTMDMVDAPSEGDLIVEHKGARVYVAADALTQVRGTTMDWQDEIFATGFKFTNPNETGRCGCGESFTV